MKGKLIITKMKTKQAGHETIISALFSNQELLDIQCEELNSTHILGNIYIGRVQNIVANIKAAFVDIGIEEPCYYSLEEKYEPIFTKRQNPSKICIGDEFLVQVEREGMKTKAPYITGNLNFTGKYMVLTSGNKRLGLSSKLKESEKEYLREIFSPFCSNQYGIIVRTNAKDATLQELTAEFNYLRSQFEHIIEVAPYRTCFSFLYQSMPEYVMRIRDTYSDSFQEIVTDDVNLHQEIKNYLEQFQPEDSAKLILYQDSLLSLAKLYSLQSHIDELLKERVWMKSGGYLIIQPTEALTVIDVNTGKYIKKKNQDETYLKINLEAAEEIAKQIRLRNISGIILIDFINLEEEMQTILIEKLKQCIKKDPIKTNFIDMTRLHLAELTRKKVRKPLHEQLTILCPTCHGTGFLY